MKKNTTFQDSSKIKSKKTTTKSVDIEFSVYDKGNNKITPNNLPKGTSKLISI